MFLPTLFALVVLCSPVTTEPPHASFDSVVPRLPGGYGPGRVSIRIYTVDMPGSAATPLIADIVSRTGVAITETRGARIELVGVELPRCRPSRRSGPRRGSPIDRRFSCELSCAPSRARRTR